MKFYSITDDSVSEDGHACFATLKEARAAARECADLNGRPVEVDLVEAATDKQGIIALANGRGWCLSRETVFTAQPRKRKKETD